MKRLNSNRLIEEVSGKGLVIPKEGWRAGNFRRYGQALIMAMHRTAIITQRQQSAILARKVAAEFKGQIDEVLRRFQRTSLFGRSVKAGTDIFIGAHEELVLSILQDVLKETGADVIAEIVPTVQSTLAQGYAKTSAFLVQRPKDNSLGLQRRARELASRVTGLSETTRTRLRNLLNGAVKERLSVAEAAKMIAEKLPKLQGSRALTIARTELNGAWTEGSIQAFKESNTITEVSVVGCESRERERWDSPSYQPYLYRGESTCNIQGVPVADADKLEWHVNHTGSLVPSGFIE